MLTYLKVTGKTFINDRRHTEQICSQGWLHGGGKEGGKKMYSDRLGQVANYSVLKQHEIYGIDANLSPHSAIQL